MRQTFSQTENTISIFGNFKCHRNFLKLFKCCRPWPELRKCELLKHFKSKMFCILLTRLKCQRCCSITEKVFHIFSKFLNLKI